MLDMEGLIALAAQAGFEHAAPLDAATLALRDDVRAMCNADACGMFGRNWSCPPHCGELAALRPILAGYRRGILVQTVGGIEDSFDFEAMAAAEALHKRRFADLHARLLREFPNLLALGAGACTLCETCTCPNAPCRLPEKRVSSMEAFGILVMDACRRNGLKYYYGPQAIAYTSCFLLE